MRTHLKSRRFLLNIDCRCGCLRRASGGPDRVVRWWLDGGHRKEPGCHQPGSRDRGGRFPVHHKIHAYLNIRFGRLRASTLPRVLLFVVHPVGFPDPFDSTLPPSQIVAVIPARFASTRFPGKPLAVPIVAPPQARVSLDGIATDVFDGQEQRTAILNTDSGVVLVKEGEQVAGQFRVVKIAADAVELVNVTDGSTLRIVLR